MDYNTSKNIIRDLETSLDVDKFEYKDYHVWPIIKYYYFIKLIIKPKNTDVNQTRKDSIKVAQKNVGKNYIQFVNTFFLAIVSYLKYSTHFFSFKLKVNPSKFLFIDVKDSLYEDVVKGEKYSKYISPYLEFAQKDNSCILLNTIGSKLRKGSKVIEPVFMNSKEYVAYKKVSNQIFNKFQKPKEIGIENFKKIDDYFGKETLKNPLDEKYFIYLLDEILIYEKFWLKVLKTIKPKVIFLECYYGNLSNYGLISAAKKKSIKIVDIQHGVALDVQYLNWDKAPEHGYEFLPDYYWCWGKKDVDNVLKTRNKSKELLPVVGGNLWYAKSLSEDKQNEQNILLEKLIIQKESKKIILVSLQHSIPVSQILIEAIKGSDQSVLWLIRFHPRDYVDPEYRSSYIKAFEGQTNVEYQLSTSANMYTLFSLVNFHITSHSNVAVEAISFKVPTILLGTRFVDFYKDYINAGHFYVAEDDIQILEYIETGITINEDQLDFYKMQSDESIARDLLKLVSD